MRKKHRNSKLISTAGSGFADAQSSTFNLNGQRFGSGYKGIVVKNGKKVRQ